MSASLSFEALQRRMTQHLDVPQNATAALDARLLLEHASGLSPTALAIQAKQDAPAALIQETDALLALRLTGMPVAKIIGHKEFWGRRFYVSASVLDPRPDSETLIETALAVLPENVPLRLMDLGTGSGCLLLTLLAERPLARGVGIDKSRAALSMARRNAHQLATDIRRRVALRHGDWLTDAPLNTDEPVDMIVTNPPYIESRAIATLDRDVRLFDPRLALDGGADGLGAYRKLIAPGLQRLKSGGHMVLEIGATQADAISKLLAAAGFVDIARRQDLAGRDRVLISAKP